MSKKNEKRKRHVEREKKSIRDSLLVAIIGVIFLALGVASLIENRYLLKEYENSTDKREVYGTVKNLSREEDDDGETYWNVRLKYTVNGEEYEDKTTLYYKKVELDQKVKVDIHRKSNGDYVINKVRNKVQKVVRDIISYMALGVGALLTIAGVTLMISSKKEIKELEEKIERSDLVNNKNKSA